MGARGTGRGFDDLVQHVDLAELGRFANISGVEAARHISSHSAGHRDAFLIHAPVGSFEANEFGLCDMTGNLLEWCRDPGTDYGQTPRAGDGLRSFGTRDRVWRGGGYNHVAVVARITNREWDATVIRSDVLGVRPSRGITTE